MKAIVAVDLNWGIGYKGDLLQPIPEDLKYFKQLTLGKVVVMGRETFESLPGQKPLKDRQNIVLSRNENFVNGDVIKCTSLDELFNVLANYSKDDIFVIGGESIYSQLLPYCTDVFVTKIENRYVADKYFINIDQLDTWKVVSESGSLSYGQVKFRFLKYINKK